MLKLETLIYSCLNVADNSSEGKKEKATMGNTIFTNSAELIEETIATEAFRENDLF